jgi:WD40-like Beta Propeller Repeat
MKRFWAALGVAVVSLFAEAGCNDYGNTFQVPTGAVITSLSPGSVSAGSSSFTLIINGNGFVSKMVVQWNGKTIPTTLTTDSAGNVTGVSASVDSSLVAKQGTAFVNTLSPHSGAGTNGLSNVLAFIINPLPNPVPAITSISPTQAPAGSGPLTLTITGSNFLPTGTAPGVQACGSPVPSGQTQGQMTSCVNWTEGSTQTVFTTASANANMSITTSTIQLSIPASLLMNTGCASVTVYNPPSPQVATPGTVPNPNAGGGGTSNAQTFTVGTAGSCPSSAAKGSTNALQRILEETPSVSADGRYVAYGVEQNGHAQIVVRDTCQGVQTGCVARTSLVSAANDGTAGNDDSRSPSISSDGRYVAFSSAATNLLSDAPTGRQIYVRDTCAGAKGSCTPSTELVSKDESGALVGTESVLPSISGSGRFVAFLAVTPSHSSTTAAGQSKDHAAAAATNSGYRQVFVRDTCLGATNCTPKTTRISLQPGDLSNLGDKPAGPTLSGSGNDVAVPGANSATLFSSGVAIDDRVFLAVTNTPR